MFKYECTNILPFSSSISVLQFSRDGTLLAIGTDEGSITLLETASFECLLRLQDDSSITSIEWHGSSPSSLLIGYMDGRIECLQVCSYFLSDNAFELSPLKT